MSGGLMQLVAYGAQDIYLTRNTSNTVIQQTATEEPQTIPEEPESSEGPLAIPLAFWFNQNSNLAIPLVSLQYASQNVDLGIEDYESLDYETPQTQHYNNNNDNDKDYENILN